MENLHIKVVQSKFIEITDTKQYLAVANNIIHMQHKNWILSIHATNNVKEPYHTFLSYGYFLVALTVPYQIYNMKNGKFLSNDTLPLIINNDSVSYQNKVLLLYNIGTILFGPYFVTLKDKKICCNLDEYFLSLNSNKFIVEHCKSNITQCCTFYFDKNNTVVGINCTASEKCQKQWQAYIRKDRMELILQPLNRSVIVKYHLIDEQLRVRKISIFDNSSEYDLLQIYNTESSIVNILNDNYILSNKPINYLPILFTNEYRTNILFLLKNI